MPRKAKPHRSRRRETLTEPASDPSWMLDGQPLRASAPVDQVIDYHVIYAGSAVALAAEVRRHLKIGWQPFGGASVTYRTVALPVYCQAIVRYQEAQ